MNFDGLKNKSNKYADLGEKYSKAVLRYIFDGYELLNGEKMPAKEKAEWRITTWEAEYPDIPFPQQRAKERDNEGEIIWDGIECGVLFLAYVELLFAQIPFLFSITDMPVFRNRLALDIINLGIEKASSTSDSKEDENCFIVSFYVALLLFYLMCNCYSGIMKQTDGTMQMKTIKYPSIVTLMVGMATLTIL